MNTVLLSLGSNIQPEIYLPAAVNRLAALGEVAAVSSIYETLAVGDPTQPNFLNAAVILMTPLSADLLKQQLSAIELSLGRQRSANPNAARTIDLDIALFNHDTLQIGKRRIPDPDVLTQPYLARPLAELAPDFIHPETGQTLSAIAAPFCQRTDIWRRDDVHLPAVKATRFIS
jgi:2-amino-4-hydroxy-6-hydroxymethyldihydropteridine diphosphokinase